MVIHIITGEAVSRKRGAARSSRKALFSMIPVGYSIRHPRKYFGLMVSMLHQGPIPHKNLFIRKSEDNLSMN
jgi:hypothetical protein